MWVDQLWITIAQSPTNQKHGCTLDAWYSLKPWGILTEAPFPPFSRHINTSRVCSMLGHQHVLKKKNIPFDAINPFLRATILEAYPTKSQKVDSSKNPAQFVVAVFLIFSKKKKNCVQKETSQQNPPTDFTTRSRSSVSRIRRVPISGVGHRMFGGRWKPPREVPRESRGRKSLLVRGIPFFWLGMWSLELCLEAIFF